MEMVGDSHEEKTEVLKQANRNVSTQPLHSNKLNTTNTTIPDRKWKNTNRCRRMEIPKSRARNVGHSRPTGALPRKTKRGKIIRFDG